MSSKKYASPLRLEVGSSIQLLVLLSVLHSLSFILLFFIPLPLWFILPSGLLITTSGIYSIRFHALKNMSSSIVSLVWAGDDEWRLFDRMGNEMKATLDGNSYIHPLCSVLVFKRPRLFKSKSLVLLSDNINKDDFRRLRVRLKITDSSIDAD